MECPPKWGDHWAQLSPEQPLRVTLRQYRNTAFYLGARWKKDVSQTEHLTRDSSSIFMRRVWLSRRAQWKEAPPFPMSHLGRIHSSSVVSQASFAAKADWLALGTKFPGRTYLLASVRKFTGRADWLASHCDKNSRGELIGCLASVMKTLISSGSQTGWA